MMILPTMFTLIVVFLWISVFFPQEEKKKTPEQELGDALAKYLGKIEKTPPKEEL